MTPENFGTPGLTDYRNPNLADAMRTLKLVQRFGQGFYIANNELEKAGNPPLCYRVDNSSVTVIIKPNPNFAADTREKLVKKQVGIKSAQSIAEELGFPLRRDIKPE